MQKSHLKINEQIIASVRQAQTVDMQIYMNKSQHIFNNIAILLNMTTDLRRKYKITFWKKISAQTNIL